MTEAHFVSIVALMNSITAQVTTHLESFEIPLPARAGTFEELMASLDERRDRTVPSQELIDFCRTIWDGEIPEGVPEMLLERTSPFDITHFIVCPALQIRGYYARATKSFAESVAHIGLGTVLDPFAGSGYMVKAFREAGIPTIATDDYSWGFQGPAEKLDALAAVRKYADQIDTVLISWVPPGDSVDFEIYKLLQAEYPHINIMVISEGIGGCTGSDAFADIRSGWEELYGYETTWGLRDYCTFLPGIRPED